MSATALARAGSRVAIRPVYPALPPAVTRSGGRAPRPNEAIASASAAAQLGLVEGVGSVTGSQFTGPVVGTFTAAEPLAHLNDSLLVVHAATDDMPLRSVHVVARSVHDVEPLERILPTMLHVSQPLELRVDSPAVLSDLQQVVQGVLGRRARQLMLILLGCGLILTALAAYAATATRRRDFGRRRALGASRSAILGLVLLSTGMVAGPGALLGAFAGSLIVAVTGQSLPPLSFAFGVAILSLLAALAAAVPPAIAAGLRDPVRILRVPSAKAPGQPASVS